MMLSSKTVEPREPTFELNSFNEPMEVTGPDAWIRDVVAIALYEEGTFVEDPECGVNTSAEVYNFLEESVSIIRNKLSEACKTYLKNVPIQTLSVSSYYWDEKDTYVVVISVSFKYESSLKSYNAYVTTIDHQLMYVVSQL